MSGDSPAVKTFKVKNYLQRFKFQTNKREGFF